MFGQIGSIVAFFGNHNRLGAILEAWHVFSSDTHETKRDGEVDIVDSCNNSSQADERANVAVLIFY